MKSFGFILTFKQLIEFSKRCKKQNAVTFEERLKVMEQMAKERRAFPQTAEQLKKRLKGKRVLRIKHDRPNS